MNPPGEIPLGVREGEAAKDNPLYGLTGLGPPFDTDDLGERRRDGLHLAELLAGAGLVVERAGRAVEIPFARRIEYFESALQVIKIAGREFEHRAFAETDDMFFLIHAEDGQARFDP